jgi:hypothetical protein
MQLASTTWFARTHPDTLPAHARPQNPQMSYLRPTELGKWADITLAMNMLASEDAVRGCHVRRGGTSKDTLPCFGIFIADRVFMHGIRSWPWRSFNDSWQSLQRDRTSDLPHDCVQAGRGLENNRPSVGRKE